MTIEVGKTAVAITPRMPKLSLTAGNLLMKTGDASTEVSSQPAFFTNMAAERGAKTGAQVTLATTTTRQTILNIVSGVSGILTHVVGLETQVVNTASLFITVDGDEVEYGFYTTASGSRLVLGGVLQVQPQTTDLNTSVLGFKDAGWISAGGIKAGLITAEQAIYEGIGIPFTDSLKVEVQYATLPAGNVTERSAGVSYVRN